jgi:hypothetical protein
VSTRIGTNPDDTKCGGHNKAVGLRLYYDAANRPSAFAATITPDPSAELYLRSDGTSCGAAPTSGVTARILDPVAPAAASAKCKDSGSIDYAGGNPWVEVGGWSLAPRP